jgi:hypothetical protein
MINKRMNRRTFLCGLTLGTLAAPLAGEAQQTERVYRIGFLTLGAPPTLHGMWHHLLEEMRTLNYVEGQNLVVKLGIAEGRPERLPSLVVELMKANVDVIVTTSTQETLAAKKATSAIPIVMTVVPDPVEQGTCGEPGATGRERDRPDHHGSRHEPETDRVVAGGCAFSIAVRSPPNRSAQPVPRNPAGIAGRCSKARSHPVVR